MPAIDNIDELLGKAYRAVIENRWGDAQMLIANIQYQRSLAPSGEATPDAVLMEAIELTIKTLDAQRSLPRHAQVVNYAEIIRAARLHQEKQ